MLLVEETAYFDEIRKDFMHVFINKFNPSVLMDKSQKELLRRHLVSSPGVVSHP